VYAQIETWVLVMLLAPLLGALCAGLCGPWIGPRGAHRVTIALMSMSVICALCVFKMMLFDHAPTFVTTLYTWGVSGSFAFHLGLLVDPLSAMMSVVVTFVSLCVHIYSVAYMQDDAGYQRFFSYMSLFTFAMLCLVLAHDFVMLYFGWEGVGLVSYLLIGFWFKKESAAAGSLKAFLVNRVGDLGFLLAIAAVLYYFGTLDYVPVFNNNLSIIHKSITLMPGVSCSAPTLICLLLFVGAAAKSAQIPLHVWLPESMEGPTPISALIHAATMVTAGVYMLTRMSPLFSYSATAQSVVLVLGGLTCLLMGILAVFHHDIKRVIAYSTLSQLGYMMVGVGASAYAAGMFHLMMHAFFKALLFLAAGSVIIALHHEQDLRKMGGLWRKMPVTWLCFLVGALSLSAIPPFSGFYSKDAIIEAVHASSTVGAGFAYICVLSGALITALYIFRCFFLTFHGQARDQRLHQGAKESSRWVLWPLIVLAIPSLFLGGLTIHALLYAHPSAFGQSIVVLAKNDVLATLALHFHGAWSMVFHALLTVPFYFSVAGIFLAWLFNLRCPHWRDALKQRLGWLMFVFEHKYGFDAFNRAILGRGTRACGALFYHWGDLKLIDACVVNGSGRVIQWGSRLIRRVQTGFLYHGLLAMVLGLFFLLAWIWVVQ
jgi:NADH-quinone oxidoreductase subunit L